MSPGESVADLVSTDLRTRELIRIPTAFVKTQRVLGAWVWDSVGGTIGSWPRQLVWCLPMGVVVQQTYGETVRWLERLGLLAATSRRSQPWQQTVWQWFPGRPPLTIAQHARNVCSELDAVLEPVDLPAQWRSHLAKSAVWHDVGKAHAAFQQGLCSANAALDANQLWAKSGKKARLKHRRKYFRHEPFPLSVGMAVGYTSAEASETARAVGVGACRTVLPDKRLILHRLEKLPLMPEVPR